MVAHARTAFVLVALAAAPAAAAQGALGQLCEIAGRCIDDVQVPLPPPPTPVPDDSDESDDAKRAVAPARKQHTAPRITTEQMIRSTVATTLIEGLIQGIFSTPKEDPAAAEAARQAQLEAARRRAEQVQSQRAVREAENSRSMEEMRMAISDPFDGGGALPNAGSPPVVLDPGATTVGLFAPPENPFRRDAHGEPTAGAIAAEKLARLAAENADVARLAGNLSDLEARLAEARAQMVDVKRGFTWVAREYERHEETVAQTVEDAKERGMSLAFEGLFKASPKAVEALAEVRSNRAAWGTLVGLLRETEGAAQAVKGAADFAGERAEEAAWLGGEKDLRTNLEFLAKRLGGPYYETGASIVASAVAIRRQLEAARGMRELSGVDAEYRARYEALRPTLAGLQRSTREAREALARKTGIAAEDLKQHAEPPKGLGYEVPHPLDR
ncbi:MAG: hypothetical protein WCC48_13480 [Anaeromyxobacteraceae bacterium]